MDIRHLNFLPWTKALHAAGAPAKIRNARGYWGVAEGHEGRVVCSVWSDHCDGVVGKASIPHINKGGYREAASALISGDEVIVVLRSRVSNEGSVLPTLWRVDCIDLNKTHSNNVGWLFLSKTNIQIGTISHPTKEN